MVIPYISETRFIPTGVGNGFSSRSSALLIAVHPHGGGERGPSMCVRVRSFGSSPRGWGTGCPDVNVSLQRRFIPTGVGNGGHLGFYFGAGAVHPHGGGERAARARSVRPATGSSPRGWGTEREALNAGEQERFIPTGVGNGGSARQRAVGTGVHPHGGGERAQALCDAETPNGSSPRGWGTGKIGQKAQQIGRFIPTGVGNGLHQPVVLVGHAVHPHGGGERYQPRQVGGERGGSSPRGWGTAGRADHQRAARRFIPTGVGNGCTPQPCARVPTVHPHGGGERLPWRQHPQADVGSSPRGWGTGRRNKCKCRRPRFIPTGVGNGRSVSPPPLKHPVHPHGGGERGCMGLLADVHAGSSPRGWGTGAGDALELVELRFIPTGVGNGSFPFAQCRAWAVHPHGGGERVTPFDQVRPVTRFIPTGVGNGSMPRPAPPVAPVHPHGGGERWCR